MISLLAACDAAPPPSSAPVPTTTPAAKPTEPKPAAAKPAPGISQEQAKAFGEQLAKAMNGCDADTINAMFDNDALTARIAKLAPAAAGSSMQFGTMMCNVLPKGSSARFLRVADVGGEVRPRIRGLVNGGVNYFEPMLERRGDKVIAVDMFSVRNGEPMSVVVGFAGSLLAMPDGENVARTFVDMSTRFGQGDYRGAREKYRALPEKARAIKSVAMYGLSIDAKLDDASYLAAMTAFEKSFPKDPSTPLVKIDYFVLTKNTPKLIESIDQLAAQVGGDPYLLVMRANAHFGAKDYTAAVADARAALTAEPDLVAADDALLDAAVEAKDFDTAIVALDAMLAGDTTKADVDKLARTEPRYKSLLRSPAYKAWLGGAKPAAKSAKPKAMKAEDAF